MITQRCVKRGQHAAKRPERPCDVTGCAGDGELLIQVGTARPRRVCAGHARDLAVAAGSLAIDCSVVAW